MLWMTRVENISELMKMKTTLLILLLQMTTRHYLLYNALDDPTRQLITTTRQYNIVDDNIHNALDDSTQID